MCVVGSSSRVSRTCTGLVFSLKLSTVQTTHSESVLWNDWPISTGMLATVPILASGDYCKADAADPCQPSVNARHHPGASRQAASMHYFTVARLDGCGDLDHPAIVTQDHRDADRPGGDIVFMS